MRIFNTYGPRLRPADGRVVSNFLVQAMRGEPLTVFGDGTQTRSFCYVDDEVRGIVALLDSDHVGPVNIGNPNEFTILELAEAVLEVTGSKSEIAFEPLPVDDPTQRRPDITLARAARLGAGGAAPRGPRAHVRLVPRRVRRGRVGSPVAEVETGGYRKLSVIVPVFNERNTVVEIMRRMRAVELPIDREFVLVDDGSSDGTQQVIDQLGDSTVKVVKHPQNRGKGAAIRTGLEHVTGDLVLIQDADLEYDPEDWPKLLAPIFRGRATVVYGSRFTGERRNMLFLHWMGNRLLSLVDQRALQHDARATWRRVTSCSTAGARRHHDPLRPVRLRARDHREGPPAGGPHLRGADLLHRSRVRRGQEDHLAGRLRRALRAREVPLRA